MLAFWRALTTFAAWVKETGGPKVFSLYVSGESMVGTKLFDELSFDKPPRVEVWS